MRRRLNPALLLALLALSPLAMGAGAVDSATAERGCAAIRSRVDAIPGHAPLLLRSYDDAGGSSPGDEPALATAAFVYDNALAVIALMACGNRQHAERIGSALALAVAHDPRLRNTYRDGRVDGPAPLPNGWWNAAEQRWNEDPYQLGTATGNVAWTGLAMLTLADGAKSPRWRLAAESMATWIVDNAATDQGFSGGVHGFDIAPKRLTWKSTEHNIDAAALFAWLGRDQVTPRWKPAEINARRFIDQQWQSGAGYFLIGTLADGSSPNRLNSGLDAQLWPLLLDGAPLQWRRSLDYAERVHGVDGGFDYDGDRDGLWTEGTAQAALAMKVAGKSEQAKHAITVAATLFSKDGYVFATRIPRISTGLAIGPESNGADFWYYRRPHLGATAWLVLADTGWNPMTGRRLAASPPGPRP